MPVGLAGLAINTPLSGASACAAASISGVNAYRLLALDVDLDHLQAERAENVAIGRIARRRDRNPVAGIEGRQGRQG